MGLNRVTRVCLFHPRLKEMTFFTLPMSNYRDRCQVQIHNKMKRI